MLLPSPAMNLYLDTFSYTSTLPFSHLFNNNNNNKNQNNNNKNNNHNHNQNNNNKNVCVSAHAKIEYFSSGKERSCFSYGKIRKNYHNCKK